MIGEFEAAIHDLQEAYIQSDIDFNTNYNEWLNECVLNEMSGRVVDNADGGGRTKLKKAIEAVRNMVYSFFDFVTGALITLCEKLEKIGELRKTGFTLRKKGKDARDTVKKYWEELKATKGTDYGEGKINFIRTKISNVIAKFKKLCDDVREKLRNFIDRSKMRGAAADILAGDSLGKEYKKMADKSHKKHKEVYYNAMSERNKRKAVYANERLARYKKQYDDRLNDKARDARIDSSKVVDEQ